MDSFHSVADLI